MTKLEFMIEASLKLIDIRPCASMEDIYNMAHELSERIFSGSEIDERDIPLLDGDAEKASIEVILKYIDEHHDPYSTWMDSYRPYFKKNNIETVGDLCALGGSKFMELPGMGKVIAMRISKALKDLYGIDQWYTT